MEDETQIEDSMFRNDFFNIFEEDLLKIFKVKEEVMEVEYKDPFEDSTK